MWKRSQACRIIAQKAKATGETCKEPKHEIPAILMGIGNVLFTQAMPDTVAHFEHRAKLRSSSWQA